MDWQRGRLALISFGCGELLALERENRLYRMGACRRRVGSGGHGVHGWRVAYHGGHGGFGGHGACIAGIGGHVTTVAV